MAVIDRRFAAELAKDDQLPLEIARLSRDPPKDAGSPIVGICVRILVCLLLFSVSAGAALGGAAPSDLDPSFGRHGRLVTPFSPFSSNLAVDELGRLLVAGVVDDEVVVHRYDRAGRLDATFAQRGLSKFSFYGEPADGVQALLLQPDGRLVLAVTSYEHFTILRLTANGAPDPTFQPKLFSTFAYPSRVFSQLAGLLVGADGDLEVVRLDYYSRADIYGLSRTMYDRDGSTVVAEAWIRVPPTANVRAALDPQGRLLAAQIGYTSDDAKAPVEIVRYAEDLVPDSTFGTDGVAATGLIATTLLPPLAVTSRGELVTAATIGERLQVARLQPDGDPDADFGEGGVATVALGKVAGVGQLALTPDGRTLVPTSSFDDPTSAASTWRLVALAPDGSIDATFGDGGMLTQAGESFDFSSYPVVVKRDGRILVTSFVDGHVVVRQLVGFPRICGDADGDGAVTVTDGVNILRAAADLSSECRAEVCDVDGSSRITITDGVQTLRAAAGLPVALRCSDRPIS